MLPLLQGVIIGFSIAAPIGPIGVLCIHRTLTRGWWFGLVTGLGASTANVLYSFVAASGVTAFAQFLTRNMVWFQVAGAAFLTYLGAEIAHGTRPERAPEHPDHDLLSAYGSALAITLASPTTILLFAAIFSGVRLEGVDGIPTLVELSAGVFLGSLIWWIILNSGVALFRRELRRLDTVINRVVGVALILLALLMLIRAWPR